jgi:hypothetical protein
MTCVGLNSRTLSWFFLSVLLISSVAKAQQEMQFSEEELPREAVMPRLDTPKAVLNRKLSYTNRFTVDAAAGWLLDEPFYNNQYFAVQGTYNWTEASGAGLKILNFGSGLSDYSKQFAASVSPGPDFNRAKGPKSGFMGFYERRMMYGKLSISKNTVIPAFLTWELEGGMMSYGSRNLPLAGAGISNRFFVTPHLGVTLALHGYVRQTVDPLSAELRNNPAPAESDFKTTTKLSTALDLSLSYLF